MKPNKYLAFLIRAGLVIPAFLLSTTSALPDTVSRYYSQAEPQLRIINGSKVTSLEYPWMANLQIASTDDPTDSSSCGGSLIHSQWILTAAHCFIGPDGSVIPGDKIQVTARLNTLNIEPADKTAIEVNSAKVYVHPQYNPDYGSSNNPNDYDMALIKLDREITEITPVVLNSNTTIAAGTRATIMGWGTTAIDPQSGQSIDPSNTLLSTTQQIVDNDSCNSIYGGGITENMICANGLDDNDTSDTCQGDSGGPIVVQQNNQWIQIGATSFGGTTTACGDPQTPGVYSNIAKMKDFIDQTIPSGISFVMLGSSDPNSDSTTNNSSNNSSGNQQGCAATTINSNLDLSIHCLVVDNTVYQTDLIFAPTQTESLAWNWSGQISTANCIANENCASISQTDETIHMPHIQADDGNKYSVDLKLYQIIPLGFRYQTHYRE